MTLYFKTASKPVLATLIAALILFLFVPCSAHADGKTQSSDPTFISTLDAKKSVSIPFRYDPVTVPLPIVMLCVNDSKPMPFMIDTGLSAPLVLEPWVVKELDLKLEVEKVLMGSRTFRPYNRVGIKRLFFINDKEERAFSVRCDFAVVDDGKTMTNVFGAKMRIAGIVGAPVLAKSVVQFDFQNGVMRVTTAKDYAVPSDAQKYTIPLRNWSTNVNEPTNRWFASVPDAAGKSHPFLVDTGSTSTSINQEILLSTKVAVPLVKVESRSTRIDGDQVETKVLIDSLPIAGSTVRYLFAGVQPKESTLLLGNDVLSLFLVTLDFSHQRAILEPYKKSNDASDTDLFVPQTGQTIYDLIPNTDNTFSVKDLAEPGSEDGLSVRRFERGDKLISVDDAPLSGLSLLGAQCLLNGRANTLCTVVLRRKDETVTVRYVREGLFGFFHGGVAQITSPKTGTSIVRYKDGTIRVEPELQDRLVKKVTKIEAIGEKSLVTYDDGSKRLLDNSLGIKNRSLVDLHDSPGSGRVFIIDEDRVGIPYGVTVFPHVDGSLTIKPN